jgi:hypothetical protein
VAAAIRQVSDAAAERLRERNSAPHSSPSHRQTCYGAS